MICYITMFQKIISFKIEMKVREYFYSVNYGQREDVLTWFLVNIVVITHMKKKLLCQHK